jgi:hypothetical protein
MLRLVGKGLEFDVFAGGLHPRKHIKFGVFSLQPEQLPGISYSFQQNNQVPGNSVEVISLF